MIVICMSEKNKPHCGTRKDIFPIFFLSVSLGIASMLLSYLVFVIYALLFPHCSLPQGPLRETLEIGQEDMTNLIYA